MDSLGDGDELAHEDDFPAEFFTTETRILTGAGLVLAGLLSNGLFQFLSFFVLSNDRGSTSPWVQYAIYAGPSGVMTAGGAALAWTARRAVVVPGMRGLCGATVIVGAVITAAVVAGTVLAARYGPTTL